MMYTSKLGMLVELLYVNDNIFECFLPTFNVVCGLLWYM